MNEEQKTEITKILIGIAEKGEQVTTDIYSLLQQQSPQLVEEILKWSLISNLIWGFGVLILFCFVFRFSWVYIKKRLEVNRAELNFDQDMDEDDRVLGSVALVLVNCIIFSIALSNFFNVLKIYIAPRLFIVEYIKVLIG